jgi:hypothetical protein
VKTFAKTFLVLLLTLGVLVGQTGIAAAKISIAKPAVCEKCPCESRMPKCCIKESKQSPTRQTPAQPSAETRWIQPAMVCISGLVSLDFNVAVVGLPVTRRSPIISSSPVPLFLRHRAILI